MHRTKKTSWTRVLAFNKLNQMSLPVTTKGLKIARFLAEYSADLPGNVQGYSKHLIQYGPS